jgi:hypothetical protein
LTSNADKTSITARVISPAISVVAHLDLSGAGSRWPAKTVSRSAAVCACYPGDIQVVTDKGLSIAIGTAYVRRIALELCAHDLSQSNIDRNEMGGTGRVFRAHGCRTLLVSKERTHHHDRAPLHRGQYLLVARMQGFAVYSAIDVFHLDRSSSTKLRSPTVEANCCTSAW